MIRKSGCRFSEKIMRNQKDEESDFNSRIQDGSAGGWFGKKSQDGKT
jgi:hypothetical protein